MSKHLLAGGMTKEGTELDYCISGLGFGEFFRCYEGAFENTYESENFNDS